MNLIKTSHRYLLILSFCTFFVACVPTTSVKPAATSTSSSSSSTASASSQGSGKSDTQSQSQTAKAGSGSGTVPSQSGVDEGAVSQANTASVQTADDKTDEQILEEALAEFDAKMKQQQQPPSTQSMDEVATLPRAEINEQAALTNTEKNAGLNKQLDEKLAKFDDLMLGEREAITRKDNEAGAGRYHGGTGGERDDPLQTSLIDEPPMPASNSRSPGLPNTSGRETESVSEIPPDIGNGQDDDIIARQLREAAVKERDPELREKLWDEYRKYKKGSATVRR